MKASEQVFQLLCGSLSPESPELDAPGAWEELVAAAQTEGVAPLVAFRLKGQVAGDQRRWCDRTLTASWSRHDRNYANLKHLAGRLEDAGVPFLALKGPVLAARCYSPPFLRKPSFDLDLAVGQADLEAACGILSEEGYRIDGSLRMARETSHHVVLTHSSGPRVELHFRLSHGTSGLPVEQFLARSVRYEGPDGFGVSILRPADEIMHLVLHLVQDRFSTLFHFLEVWKVWKASTPGIRDEAVRQAVAYRFAGALALADAAFRYRMGEGILPDDAQLPRTWLHHRINEGLYKKMRAAVVLPHQRTVLGRLRGRWLDLQTTDGPSDALRKLPSLARIVRYSLWRGSSEDGRPAR